MKETKFVELSQEPTTIWVKKGTKRMLDSVGERKESYDDIIQKLIRERELNASRIRDLAEYKARVTKGIGAEIKISDVQLRKSRLIMGNEEYIEFMYYVPLHIHDFEYMADYRFNITYVKEHINYKEDKDIIKQKAKHYLQIVEKIIQLHFNSFFKIAPKHHLDFAWWHKEFKKLGLSEKTYAYDIIDKLIKIGLVYDENVY